MNEFAGRALSITPADSDDDRRVLRDLLARHIDDIADTAIPKLSDDHYYNPLILQAQNATGDTIGGALTCRPPIAVAAHTGSLSGLPPLGYESVLDKVSFLDLMAVDTPYRRKGIGRRLINEMETRLARRGTRIWVGSVTDEENHRAVAAFYSDCGFTVLQPGQPLPPFLGKDWMMPMQQAPVFWFYKRVIAQP